LAQFRLRHGFEQPMKSTDIRARLSVFRPHWVATVSGRFPVPRNSEKNTSGSPSRPSPQAAKVRFPPVAMSL